ncbi:MAG TPA: ribbon-helix-helix domain-containing protein [Parvularculaceae bacterium]|nr:ribbon-helix-helix domain-containing protein [Parvularculaceae bacterium]
MKRTNFYYPEALLERLAALRERTGIAVSEHIRRAIEDYLRKHKA